MGKKVLSCLLCVIFLITAVPITAEAEESTYYAISIDAGNGVQTEKAIIKDDEIYIAATSFSKYTRFEFDEATQTFLIKGQEADKAFMKIIVNAETKKAAVGTKLIELENSFVVDGIVYLPFCQMLPILNADIIEVASGVIYVVNNELSMAELLYDFDINDYLFNISEEFFGRTDLLYWYIAPSYLFDTVVNFRFDRLDIIFDSGTSQDYQTILTGYLKDDELFHKAKSENDFAGNLLESITGLTGISDTFNDVYDWAEKVAKLEIEEDLQEYFEFEELELFIKKGYADGAFDDELSELLGVVHDDMITNDILQDAIPGGTSFADILEAVDYIYSLLNQVDDHRKMLDAVYNITGNQVTSELVPGASSPYFAYDLEHVAAAQVYELYSGDIVPAYTKKVTEEIVKRLFEDRTLYNAFGVYKLTAGLSGEILELYLPGDSGDRAMLSQHSDIVNTAMRKAAVPTLDTEESTDEYRLSLLLTLLASRACYDIMAETASGYGQDDGYYQGKIDDIEEMIMGLYLVADNVAFDTYENYGVFAEQNRNIIKSSGLFEDANIYIGVDEPDYKRECFIEIIIEWDGKYPGSEELIDISFDVSGTLNDGSNIVCNGSGQYYNSHGELIGVYNKELSENKGIISIYLYVDGDFEFVGVDGNYSPVNSMSINAISDVNAIAYVKVAGQEPVALESKNDLYRSYTGYWFWGICGVHKGIVTEYDSSWISKNSSHSQADILPVQSVEERVKEIRELYYEIQNDLPEYKMEDGGSDTTRYLDKEGKIKKIVALKTTYSDLNIDSEYTAEYFYDNDKVFFLFLHDQSEEHRIYLDKNDYTKCVRYVDEIGRIYDYPDGKDVNELSGIGQYCGLAMQELHWAGVL